MSLHDTLFLFDIDDTLTDSGKVGSQCFARAFRDLYGVEDLSINWRDYPHVTDWGLSQTAFKLHLDREVTSQDLEDIERVYNEHLHNAIDTGELTIEEVPGAGSFLQYLEANNCHVGYATGGWSYSARLKLEEAGLPKHWSIASSDIAWSRTGIMTAAIEAAAVDKVVYFADGLWDVTTCRELGVPMVGVDFSGSKGLEGLGVQHVFSDYHDVQALMDCVQALVR